MGLAAGSEAAQKFVEAAFCRHPISKPLDKWRDKPAATSQTKEFSAASVAAVYDRRLASSSDFGGDRPPLQQTVTLPAVPGASQSSIVLIQLFRYRFRLKTLRELDSTLFVLRVQVPKEETTT